VLTNDGYQPRASIPEKALEPGGRQLGITHRMLDRFMPEIGLDRAGIDGPRSPA